VKFNSTCKPHICIYLTCWCKWSHYIVLLLCVFIPNRL